MRHFRSIGTAWRARIDDAPDQPSRINIAPTSLPRGQAIVLLRLRAAKAGPASLYTKVLGKLIGSDEPTAYDETQLREAGYIAWSTPARRHVLTPIGQHIAGRVARELAGVYGIHEFTRSGGKGSGLHSRCSCGWGSPYCRDSRAGESNVRSHEYSHTRSVEAGHWRPPIAEFIKAITPQPELALERRA